MRHKDKKVNSLTDLIEYLKKDLKGYKGPVWFRGQSMSKWKLRSYFTRENRSTTEMSLIQKFRQNATLLVDPRPETLFSWLFVMQHHGIPTRLLDWSESPLFAIYFAAYEHTKSDGALWVLLPTELNRCSNIKPESTFDIPSFDDAVLKNYSPESYENEKTSQLFPVGAISPRNNQRMQAQLSVFTISHRDTTPIEDIGDTRHVWRYVIPSKHKKKILAELKLFGVGKFQLFPELQSIRDDLFQET